MERGWHAFGRLESGTTESEKAAIRMSDETLTHHLVIPRDTNHHGTLYAGVLMALALEAGYATAFRAAGETANLVLKRVLDLRCHEPVPIGSVIEIRGIEIFRASAQLVVALYGSPLRRRKTPWMDGLMQFVQVDGKGQPAPLSQEPPESPPTLPDPWRALQLRARRLRAIR